MIHALIFFLQFYRSLIKLNALELFLSQRFFLTNYRKFWEASRDFRRVLMIKHRKWNTDDGLLRSLCCVFYLASIHILIFIHAQKARLARSGRNKLQHVTRHQLVFDFHQKCIFRYIPHIARIFPLSNGMRVLIIMRVVG